MGRRFPDRSVPIRPAHQWALQRRFFIPSAADPVGGIEGRIDIHVGVALGGPGLGVAEDAADDRQARAIGDADAGGGVS